MPVSNHSNHDSDYYVGPPPPVAPETPGLARAAMMVAAATVAALFFLIPEPTALQRGFFAVTLLSLGVAFWALRPKTEAFAATARPAMMKLAAGPSRSACGPVPSPSSPGHVPAGTTLPCPDVWPAGWPVTFHQPGNSEKIYATGVIAASSCHVKLVGSEVRNEHDELFAIQMVTPP